MSDRDATRQLLRELLEEVLAPAAGNGDGAHRAPAPGAPGPAPGPAPVPAPPVAAVLRPSTWAGPTVPGEVVGASAEPAAPPPGGVRVEAVTLEGDEDLDRFVRALVARLENPGERTAILAGTLRFTLGTARTGAPAGAVRRVERGAVTERTVREAAAAGERLVLAPAAVLTPLARERARALGVEIERERRC
jgi:hypothetical protein